MSQIVKLRRSSVSGQKPTNSNLQLGELALNTTDGKVYMSKSGSLGPSVEELISTNTVNTGSIHLVGDITASALRIEGSAHISHSLSIGDGVGDLLTVKALISSSLVPDSDGIHHYVGGPSKRWEVVYGKTGSFDHIEGTTGSTVNIHNAIISGSFTGSFIGNASGLTNVPFLISGSDVSGNTLNKTFTKLQFDDSTGLNVEETDPGTAFISIGSHFRDIFVSGSEILRATGSDAFEIIGQGGIGVSTSITDTNGNGYVKELTINATPLSSSLNDRINIITGSIDGLNSFTSSVVLTSQTGSMSVLSASYAVTAAFALNAGGSGGSSIGSYSSLVVTSASSTWSFAHNTGQRYPIFQVFDNNGYVVIPSQIQTIDDNNANIIFPSPQTGRVIASLGGGNGLTQPFTSSSLWTVNHNLGTDYPDVTVWDSNRNIVFPNRIESVNANQIKIYFSQPITGNVSVSRGGHIVSGSLPSGLISGSSQITNLGFATTGSNTLVGSQTINGCLTINNAKICSTAVTISSNTEIFNLSSFDGAFFDYVVKSGVNMRAGSIVSAWNGTNSTFNETTTIDLGSTDAIGFNVSGTGALNATISSGTWLVEVLYRALGGNTIVSPTPTPSATPAGTSIPVSPTPTLTPTSTTYTVGQAALGGIIAYVLQPGDSGYDANVQHGLIATTYDISESAQWGCESIRLTGALGFAIGTGNQNTIDIITECTTSGIAAKLCADLTLGGYSDWYLPSRNELNKLYENRVAIGGFAINGGYWSSSQFDFEVNNHAYYQIFDNNGYQNGISKNTQNYVRAVRSF